MASLEREAHERGDPIAIGLVTCTHNYKFVATLLLMCDVLPHLSRLSKLFQRKDVNLAHIEPMLNSTIDFMKRLEKERGSHLKCLNEVLNVDLRSFEIKCSEQDKSAFEEIRKKFLSGVVKHLEIRFPQNQILSALGVLDPKNMPEAGFVFYGEEEIETLATHFDYDNDELLSEWVQFRELMQSSFSELNLEDVVELVHVPKGEAVKESFPKMAKLLAITATLPVGTADCERGFSEMNKTKTDLRNRMKTQTLDQLMRISVEGPPRKEFDFVSAAKQ